MAKRCVVCGTEENMTRDHVIPRLILRMALGRDRYARFCQQVRKIQIQPMCAEDNNIKGHRVCDLRAPEIHETLLQYLKDYDIYEDIEFEPPEAIFGDRLKAGPWNSI